MLYEAHVVELKEWIYSGISDASKDATGCRMRFDWRQYTVAELWEMEDSWNTRAQEAFLEEEAERQCAVKEWEDHVSMVQELMGVDRISAIAITAEPYFEDGTYDIEMCDAEGYFQYRMGLPYNYDWVRGEKASYIARCV